MTGGLALAELLVAALIVLGGGFALVGSWGLLRLPSLMERLHGPTKASTLGVGCILLAAMDIPTPVPHMSIARSARPARTSRQAFSA